MTAKLTSEVAARRLGPLSKGARLRELVTDRLLAAILSGELAPGTVCSTPMLAEVFGVSATPVREAMVELKQMGLVEALPNKGFRVTETSDADLDELAQVRGYLEPPATRDAAALIQGHQLAGFRRLAADIVRAAEQADLTAYMAADRRFHAAILEQLGNDRLVKLCTELRAQTRLFGLQRLVERDLLVSSAREHEELVDLIEARDLDGVEALMRRHIGHARGLWASGADRE